MRLGIALVVPALAASLAPQHPGETSNDLVDVVKRTTAYVQAYTQELAGIVAVESYVQKATSGNGSPARERKIISDFRATPIAGESFGFRLVREVDGMVLDPLFRGRLAEDFDLSTPEGRLRMQRALVYENSRYTVGDFAISTDIPTFPLEVFRPNNVGYYEFRKTGGETIDGTRTWKIEVRDRAEGRLTSTPLQGIFWVDPSTGRIHRASLEFPPIQPNGREMTVRYGFEPRLGMMVPLSMVFEQVNVRQSFRSRAEYRDFARFGGDVRLTEAQRAEMKPGSLLVPMADGKYEMRVDVPLVSLDAWVTGNSGPVMNLQLEDFLVSENGIQQTITNFTPVSAPYDVLLLFDRSGSARRRTLLMRRAAEGLIKNLRPIDRVGLATFTSSLHMLTRWTDTREQVLKTLSRLPDASGGTSFYRAVTRSLAAELLPLAGRRRVLVVLSDGRDNRMLAAVRRTSTVPPLAGDPVFQDLLDTARREHVPIYIVALDTDRNLTTGTSRTDEFMQLPEALRQDYLVATRTGLERLAQISGGRILFPKTMDDVVPLYQQIGEEIGSAYSFGYVSNVPPENRIYREIKVSTRDRSLHVVQSRKGYVPQ
jgi:VWFA-related protein